MRSTSAPAHARGRRPPLPPPAPRRSVQLPLIPARGSRDERRAIGLVVATASDLIEQGGILEASGAADGLRGGRYVMRRGGAVQLIDVRVVSDASVSGVLRITHQGLAGKVQLEGPGIPGGPLQIQLTETGGSRAYGRLNGRRVDFRFRL